MIKRRTLGLLYTKGGIVVFHLRSLSVSNEADYNCGLDKTGDNKASFGDRVA